jgi:hypothetical protein
VSYRHIASHAGVSKSSLVRHVQHGAAPTVPGQRTDQAQAPCAQALVQVRCLGCEAVKGCPVGEGWLCTACAQAQWQRLEPPVLEFPRWIFHHTLPACIIETPEAFAALGDGWRLTPYP